MKVQIHAHMKIPRQPDGPDRGAITAYVRTYALIRLRTCKGFIATGTVELTHMNHNNIPKSMETWLKGNHECGHRVHKVRSLTPQPWAALKLGDNSNTVHERVLNISSDRTEIRAYVPFVRVTLTESQYHKTTYCTTHSWAVLELGTYVRKTKRPHGARTWAVLEYVRT